MLTRPRERGRARRTDGVSFGPAQGERNRLFDAAGSAPLLEPPGFMLRNYGRQTPLATIASHVAYGAIAGGFVGLAG